MQVIPQPCPLCRKLSSFAYEADNVPWYECSCGIVYQQNIPNRVPSEHEAVGTHHVKTYSSVIEDLTYGRKMLDVGFASMDTQNLFKERGWITFGIDDCPSIEETDRIVNEDFETTAKLYRQDYNLIWMVHVLEKFVNPVGALRKSYKMLENNGLMFIATPDVDTLKLNRKWQYWKKDENYIFWSERSIHSELERIGFKVILSRKNSSVRFGYCDDLHIIAQKK